MQALPMLAATAISTGMNYWQGEKAADRAAKANKQAIQLQQERYRLQQEAEQKAMDLWRNESKPSPEAIEAANIQNRGVLGQARAAAYRNLGSQMAARGFGSGSGLGYEGASNIENAYIKGLGESQTELTKFANTPQFAPPGQAWPQGPSSVPEQVSVPGGLESALGGGSNLLNTALGMYMANQALYNKGPFGGSMPSFNTKSALSSNVPKYPLPEISYPT